MDEFKYGNNNSENIEQGSRTGSQDFVLIDKQSEPLLEEQTLPNTSSEFEPSTEQIPGSGTANQASQTTQYTGRGTGTAQTTQPVQPAQQAPQAQQAHS